MGDVGEGLDECPKLPGEIHSPNPRRIRAENHHLNIHLGWEGDIFGGTRLGNVPWYVGGCVSVGFGWGGDCGKRMERCQNSVRSRDKTGSSPLAQGDAQNCCRQSNRRRSDCLGSHPVHSQDFGFVYNICC